MINNEGKVVLTELEELVDPAHTALIVIDMQHDFIEPDGLFGSLGIDQLRQFGQYDLAFDVDHLQCLRGRIVMATGKAVIPGLPRSVMAWRSSSASLPPPGTACRS